MGLYILKRLFIFAPTLLVISLLAFGLSKVAPGDPVELINRGGLLSSEGQRSDLVHAERVYYETAERLGLTKPAFYFSLSSRAYPDTLYRILKRDQRETAKKFIAQYGNWSEIQSYFSTLQQFENELYSLPLSIDRNTSSNIRKAHKQLYISYKDPKINSQLKKIEKELMKDSTINAHLFVEFESLQTQYKFVKENTSKSKLYIPNIKWFGFDNQYHRWITRFFQGNFGLSYTDSRPVADKMKDALFWTLLMNVLSILLAYLISIPLGVYSARYKDSWFDKSSTILLFIFYSLPTFWIATILVVFFTTPEYGAWTDIFPSIGLGNLSSEAPLGARFLERSAHLILPVFCITYTSLAFITRQMRGGMLDVLQQDYIRTARAKGLSENKVVWKHAFRNSLFPLITLFASVFPAALAGSVVIEVIFNIPGMGKLTLDAIFSRDWPVVYTVLMLAAILTMIGILIADVLYAKVNPRVSFRK
ncbi:MAG: ABC transporter permease [Bacteroidetes bacterium]|nr:ABC transporter permease [Bacteroidota bacterium]